MPNKFGGPWTEIKLAVLQAYLLAYTTALKKQSFQLLYIDAFAGTGSVITNEGLLLNGSAKIAMETHGFDSYLFIEQDEKRCRELNHVCDEYRKHGMSIDVKRGDANEVLVSWLNAQSFVNVRGVAFLDPFGMNLEWTTLQTIVDTHVMDVWYLFSLSGLYRQATRDPRQIDHGKATAITRVLGTDQWLEEFYHEPRQASFDFWNDVQYERVNVDFLETWVRRRLESVFAKVAQPLRLPKQGPPRYSLFFGVSNPNPKAIGLAMKIANYILEKA